MNLNHISALGKAAGSGLRAVHVRSVNLITHTHTYTHCDDAGSGDKDKYLPTPSTL